MQLKCNQGARSFNQLLLFKFSEPQHHLGTATGVTHLPKGYQNATKRQRVNLGHTTEATVVNKVYQQWYWWMLAKGWQDSGQRYRLALSVSAVLHTHTHTHTQTHTHIFFVCYLFDWRLRSEPGADSEENRFLKFMVWQLHGGDSYKYIYIIFLMLFHFISFLFVVFIYLFFSFLF